MRIPIAQPDLNGNELKYITNAFLSTRVSSSGRYIKSFEKNFSKFCGCKYGVAVSNGTAALHLALVALGVGKGDQVIVPDLTFAATINAVLYTQATPVIVDIDKESWCIDPCEVKKAIRKKTKAIIPVHLYGQPCDMHLIMKIARDKGIHVVEDCAEAHGASFDNKKVGSFGDIGSFSFYGNKIITTGEGGMCVTNSKKLNDKMVILRSHGMHRRRRYWHDMVGYNYRMTNLQAALGVAQLERIRSILKGRKDIEDRYRQILSDIKTIKFQKNDLPMRQKTTWLVSALIKNGKRNIFIKKCKAKGIDVRQFFYPLSQMQIYHKYVFSNKNSVSISREGINFPTLCVSLGQDALREIEIIAKSI